MAREVVMREQTRSPDHQTELEYGPPLVDVARYHLLSRTISTEQHKTQVVRIAVLSTYTLGFLEPFLRVELRRLGLHCELFFGGFGEVESLWLNPESALHAFAPDVVVVSMRLEDVVPGVFQRSSGRDASALRTAAEATIERLGAILSHERAAAWTTLVANFAHTEPSPHGVGDASLPSSHGAIVAETNQRLRELVQRQPGVFVWDYQGVVHQCGAAQWCDDRLWFLGRIPVAARHHGALAQHLARTLRAAILPAAKVLVLDLDNTLWGGVVGDDGVDGIEIGDDFPGNQFKLVQRLALGLRDRGVLLAIASKNDLDLVQEAFRTHPDLLMRWSDFAAVSINWERKSHGIAHMAEQLQLGLDAFVFLDDNPVERAEVRASLPTVKIIDVEAWGSLHRALAACPWFDALALSAEDFDRATLYQAERSRAAAASVGQQTVEGYLTSLQLIAKPQEATAVELGRVAQLFAKTNQFNLTMRRPSEATLTHWMNDATSTNVACMRLADRFGDHGIIAAAVLMRHEKDAFIHSLVMSCRVMNRRAELAFLSYLAELARKWNCGRLIGEYISGQRNAVVSSLYLSTGFTEIDDAEGGGRRFAIDLSTESLPWPSIIERAQ